jgi:hypothetical protein
MNIFHLDEDFEQSAAYHIDKHIVKIPLECAQMLSTANRSLGLNEGYRSAYLNHPMTVWSRTCIENWLWMKSYALTLNEEWRFRYDHSHNHKAIQMILSLTEPLGLLPSLGRITLHPLCMPEYCQIPGNTVESYRNYYILEKSKIASWKSPRTQPEWFSPRI